MAFTWNDNSEPTAEELEKKAERKELRALEAVTKEAESRQRDIQRRAETYFDQFITDRSALLSDEGVKKIAEQSIRIAEIWVDTLSERFPEIKEN